MIYGFWAIYLCATDKRGISAVQLSRTLGICYDSAWHLLDRIRTAMGQRDEKYLLSGIVELDDGYVGGPSHNGKRGRGTDKAKIVVAVSKTANSAPLFARMKVVDNVQGKTLQEIIDQYFVPKTSRFRVIWAYAGIAVRHMTAINGVVFAKQGKALR